MFEELGFETISPVTASAFFALMVGFVFGAISQHIQFCFRRSIVGDQSERKAARGIWFSALASAIIGTQVLVSFDIISFDSHRFFEAKLPLFAIAIGGLMFGTGMVLTKGCISRLIVLAGTGNMRALIVCIIFSISAHATLKGIFAPLRVWAGSFTIDMGEKVGFFNLIGGAPLWTVLIISFTFLLIYKSGAKSSHIILAILIGLLIPLSWAGTGFILFDDFDPIPLQSLSFTSPSADLLFWAIASTSIPAGFGVGLIGGVILGSALTSIIKHDFKWQSFESPQQTRRYLLGAVLMGVGGVLAGGCTVGAGLAGIPTLSFAAFFALGFIAIGALATQYLLSSSTFQAPSFIY